MEKKNKNQKILKNGWIPGIEMIYVKVFIKCTIGSALITYGVNLIWDTFISGQISMEAQQHAGELFNEIAQMNKNPNVPSSFTKMMLSVMTIKRPMYAIYYVMEYQKELISCLQNQGHLLTEDQVKYLIKIINYLSQILDAGKKVGMLTIEYKTNDEFEKSLQKGILECTSKLIKK